MIEKNKDVSLSYHAAQWIAIARVSKNPYRNENETTAAVTTKTLKWCYFKECKFEI